MKIKSEITHPHVVPNLYDFSPSDEHSHHTSMHARSVTHSLTDMVFMFYVNFPQT